MSHIRYILLMAVFLPTFIHGQELYVFSDPASNIPARSVNFKLKSHGVGDDIRFGRFTYRLMPQVMAGISKKLQVRMTATAANMHTESFRGESVGLGLKYRFLSSDGIHKHFRMAAYVDGSLTRDPFHYYDEVSLMGDKTGIEAGLIATQLWHKLAVSGTISRTEVMDGSRYDRSLNYSVSAGYLLLPRTYRDYKQTNLNLYLELLGQRLIGENLFFVDIAPALQVILGSRTKINVGQRFQLEGNMGRMARRSWLISVETSFLQVWK